MTRVLVAYASKMGGTQQLAETIARELSRAGLFVQLRDAAEVTSVDGFDAAVIGSALYENRWRREAVDVLRLVADRVAGGGAVSTWLFHSGPCGPDAANEQTPAPKKVQRYAQDIGAAPVMTFGGRLQPESATGFLARRMARGPLAGDHRDFDKAREWARLIADHLAHIPHLAAPPGRNPDDQATTHAGAPATTTRRTP